MFYLLWGGNWDQCGNPDVCRHGIHAFQVDDAGTSARLIKDSESGDADALFYCHFSEADSLQSDGAYGYEPEGLVVRDLDDGRANGIQGQLHVIIGHNSVYQTDPNESNFQDNIIFKHYTSRLSTQKRIGIDFEKISREFEQRF